MSLEQARGVSISTSKKTMEPPPRRIDDIPKLVGQYHGPKPQLLERYENIIATPPPSEKDANGLALYLMEKAMAHARIGGEDSEALNSIRRAYDLDSKDGSVRMDILSNRALFEHFEGGNIKTAIELYKTAIDRPDARFSNRAFLTEAYITMGDVTKAQAVANESRQIHQRGTYDQWIEFWMSYIDGLMHGTQGKHVESYNNWKKAQNFIAEKMTINPGLYFFTQRHLIFNLIEQGEHVAAELEIRAFLKNCLNIFGKTPDTISRILLLFGENLYEQGRLDEAETIIKFGLSIREPIKSKGNLKFESDMAFAEFYKTLMDISCSRDEFGQAYSYFQEGGKFFDKDGFTYSRYFSKNFNLLLTMIFTNHNTEALEKIERLYNHYDSILGKDHNKTLEARLLRGIVYIQADRISDACKDYFTSIQKFVAARQEYSKSFSKKKRFRQILEAYISFFAGIHKSKHEKEIGIEAGLEAFKLVEVLRQQSVQQALSASAARMAVQNAELAELVRQEQDNGRMIAVLDRMLINHISMPPDQQDSKVVSDLKAQVATLTAARSTLLAEIKQKYPDYENLINPKPADYQTVAQYIRPHETLISLYPLAERSYLWAINDKGAANFVALPVGAKQIAANVDELRRSLDLSCDKLGEIPEFDFKLSHWFYQIFLEPVKGSWTGQKDLLIVADGPLGSLPFSVLTTQPHTLLKTTDLLFSEYRQAPWLVRQVALTRLPSVSALIGLRSLPPGDPGRRAFAGFGDPIFNPTQVQQPSELSAAMAKRGAQFQIRGVRVTQQGAIDQANLASNRLSMLNRLPDTAEELLSVSQSLKADHGQDVFLGPKATEQMARSIDLSNRRVVYFATHALVPGDIDGLHEPALALSSPEVAGGDEDGLLTAGEIMTLRLNADWVILSACNTAAAAGEGAEAISGLGRAFFYAGTRALLVSLWPVETSSARLLTTRLFEVQNANPELSRSEALSDSMLKLIDGPGMMDKTSGKTIASYAHPFFWAPFIIVGDN
jgi:CHAT domain-containing protein